MKILYYSTGSCLYPHIGVVLNSILEDVKNGNEVTWVYCSFAVPSCLMNPRGSKTYCKFCKSTYNNLISRYGKGVKRTIPLQITPNNKEHFDYYNSAQLKKVQYRGVQIGYSILSYVISKTRELDFVIDAELKKRYDEIISYICGAVDSFSNIINENTPDIIKTYNGRYYENRFVYDIAKAYNIEFHSLEVIGGHGEPYYPIHFPGDLPHSITLNTKLINNTWEQSKMSYEEKCKVASSFFEKRTNNISSCDRVYTASQQVGLLPEGFDNSKCNIAVFNSSADEISAIGGEWEEATKLFSSQYESLRYILSRAPENMHFYLRIHPNLKEVKYSYHTDFYKLSDEFNNITVIEPKSPISTYSLMHVCEKIIVFGSTMGVESCFWGKPVILIGTAFYALLDVCYKVQKKEDIFSLLNSQLPPKPKEGALKYAFYIMNRDVRVDNYDNIEVNYETKSICGQKYRIVNYNTILGSVQLHAILHKLFTSVVSRLF